jgi:hypothetical protein
MNDLKELILNTLVFLAGLYAFIVVYQAIIKWGNL